MEFKKEPTMAIGVAHAMVVDAGRVTTVFRWEGLHVMTVNVAPVSNAPYNAIPPDQFGEPVNKLPDES